MTPKRAAATPRRHAAGRAVKLPNWSSVKVLSCADGSMQVRPRWRGVKAWTPRDGGGPGLFTRMEAAKKLQDHINAALKSATKKK